MVVQLDESPLPNGWPRYLTRFTGREQERAELCRLLDDPTERLITVTGPGGVGKTRLLVETLDRWLGEGFNVPATFVDGAAVAESAALMTALAENLGIEQTGAESSGGLISEMLVDRQALIVLDNMEHLPGAALDVAALLRACPGVRIVTTSRTPLRLSNERLFVLEPLPTNSAADTNWSAAASLFLDRAALVRSSIDPDTVSRQTVESICERLDGLPLAIELAAARLRILTPGALLALLTRRLSVLGGGPVDSASRHRTLEAAIAWSYDLLDEEEQRLFRRLGIFPDSFSLEAVEAVGFAEMLVELRPSIALDRLTALFDQGLLQETLPERLGQSRFRMLVSIREFAHDRLRESGELEDVGDRFAAFVFQMTGARSAELTGPRQGEAMEELAAETANVRAVLERAIQRNDTEMALGLIVALWRYWANRGLLDDARGAIDRVLSAQVYEVTPLWGGALRGAAVIAEMRTDWTAARAWGESAIAVWEALGDAANLSRSWNDMGNVSSSTGDLDRARLAYERSAEYAMAAGDRRMEMVARCSLGTIALRQGRLSEAAAQFEVAEPVFRQLGDQWLLATALSNWGIALTRMGSNERAMARLRESLEIRRAIGDAYGIAATSFNLDEALGPEEVGGELTQNALEIAQRLDAPDLIGPANVNLAIAALRHGDRRAGGEHLSTALRNFQIAESPIFSCEVIELIAELPEKSDPELAARLLGGTAAIRASRSVEWRGPYSERARALQRRLKRTLGENRYEMLHQRGGAIELSELTFEALSAAHVMGAEEGLLASPSIAERLTQRELVVLRLLAGGKSDREIGAELFISPKTVNRHVTSILAKLECRNRTAAAAIAYRLGLT